MERDRWLWAHLHLAERGRTRTPISQNRPIEIAPRVSRITGTNEIQAPGASQTHKRLMRRMLLNRYPLFYEIWTDTVDRKAYNLNETADFASAAADHRISGPRIMITVLASEGALQSRSHSDEDKLKELAHAQTPRREVAIAVKDPYGHDTYR
ncbi:hypothetical protein BKA93DRAFT_31473 [Sparassis latifolia]